MKIWFPKYKIQEKNWRRGYSLIEIWGSGLKYQVLKKISSDKAKQKEPWKGMEIRSKGPNRYGISKGGKKEQTEVRQYLKNNQNKNSPLLRPKSAKIPEC